MFLIYILPTHIYILFNPSIYEQKKLCWSFCTNDRSWNHFFWVLRDSRTGISAIFNRLAYRLNDVFTKVCLYQLFGHPMNCNLNQSDEKSDQPGILGLDDPLYLLKVYTLSKGFSLKHIQEVYVPLGPYPKTDEFPRFFSENRWISLSINGIVLHSLYKI